jgi:hypothetical protein
VVEVEVEVEEGMFNHVVSESLRARTISRTRCILESNESTLSAEQTEALSIYVRRRDEGSHTHTSERW